MQDLGYGAVAGDQGKRFRSPYAPNMGTQHGQQGGAKMAFLFGVVSHPPWQFKLLLPLQYHEHKKNGSGSWATSSPSQLQHFDSGKRQTSATA